MFRGPHFIVSTMQAGTTPIFNVFGMTGPSSNRESNPQILLVSAGSPLSSPFTISRGYWGPIRYQGAPSGAPTPDPHRVGDEHVQEILTSLDVENLQKVQQCLTDAGVETEDDLHYIQEYDLMPVWKIVCLFVCGISLTSGQLVIELFPGCTRSCFSQVVLRHRGGDRIYVCLFVCGISLTSSQLVIELFPDCTRSCFSQVVLRRRGGDCIYEMRCPFVAVGLNARFIVLPHWDNMS